MNTEEDYDGIEFSVATAPATQMGNETVTAPIPEETFDEFDNSVRSWKDMLNSALKRNGESWSDVVFNTMAEEEMAKKFYTGFGIVEGCPFTVWTKNSVYFPLQYEGSEWVGRVSRNPDGNPTIHQPDLNGD